MGEVAELLHRLELAGSVCLDTVIFIYAFERHPRFGPVAQTVFRNLADGRFSACASVLAAGEVFTGVKKIGDDILLMRYREVFERFPGLAMVDAGMAVMERMADLRATYGLATPDAIHLATAIVWGSPIVLTHDLRLQRVHDVEVLTLPSFIDSA